MRIRKRELLLFLFILSLFSALFLFDPASPVEEEKDYGRDYCVGEGAELPGVHLRHQKQPEIAERERDLGERSPCERQPHPQEQLIPVSQDPNDPEPPDDLRDPHVVPVHRALDGVVDILVPPVPQPHAEEGVFPEIGKRSPDQPDARFAVVDHFFDRFLEKLRDREFRKTVDLPVERIEGQNPRKKQNNQPDGQKEEPDKERPPEPIGAVKAEEREQKKELQSPEKDAAAAVAEEHREVEERRGDDQRAIPLGVEKPDRHRDHQKRREVVRGLKIEDAPRFAELRPPPGVEDQNGIGGKATREKQPEQEPVARRFVGAGLRRKVDQDHKDPEPENIVEGHRTEIVGGGQRPDPAEQKSEGNGDQPEETPPDLRLRAIIYKMKDRAEDYGDVERNILDENVKTVVAARDEHRHQDQGEKDVRESVGEDQRDADDPEKNETSDHFPPERDDKHRKQKDRPVKIIAQGCDLIPFFREQRPLRLVLHICSLYLYTVGFLPLPYIIPYFFQKATAFDQFMAAPGNLARFP